MKKYVILLLIGVFSLLSVSVFAQTEEAVQNPGILPSSPFYFLKEWKRDTVRFFTFNSEKKAELELNEASERVAEIKKMEEINPKNVGAISKAVENYQENTERLKTQLEALKETSENPNIDKLLDKVVDRSIEHQELFDGLKEKLSDDRGIKEKLNSAQEKMEEVISKIPEQFEKSEAVKERIQLIIAQIASSSLETASSSAIKEEIKEIKAEVKEIKEEVKDGVSSGILSPLKTINTYLQEKKEQIEERKREQNCVKLATSTASSASGCEEPVIDFPVASSTNPSSASSTPSIIIASSTASSAATSTSQ
jgi:hypothetical protein